MTSDKAFVVISLNLSFLFCKMGLQHQLESARHGAWDCVVAMVLTVISEPQMRRWFFPGHSASLFTWPLTLLCLMTIMPAITRWAHREGAVDFTLDAVKLLFHRCWEPRLVSYDPVNSWQCGLV